MVKAKTTVKKAATGQSTAARAALAIAKATKQKPIKPTKTTVPHLPSGSLAVNSLIGGTLGDDGKPICPGFPRRRLIEIYGPESSGKTTLSLAAVVEAQKGGGSAMFIDFEHALDLRYAKNIGVEINNPDKWLFYQPESMEMGLTQAYIGIAAGMDVVVIDSVAGMVPQKELLKKFTDEAKIGGVAKAMAEALPKFMMWLQKHPMEGAGESKKSIVGHPGTALIFLNQTRAAINTGGYGNAGNENTSGGKALKFFSYLRIRMARIKSEFIERKDPMSGKKRRYPYGNLTDVKLVKSKVDGKQGHSTNVFIRYGVGIDDYMSIIEAGVTHKLIKKDGSYFQYGDNRFQGKEKFRKFLISDPKIFNELKEKIIKIIGASADPAATEDNITEEDLILESLEEDMGEASFGSGGDGDDEELVDEPDATVQATEADA